MQNQKLDLKALVVCLFFTAITCLLGTFTFPTQPVPITLASVGACLAGGKLGPIKGGLTQLLYLLLVLIGYPITTNVEYGVAMFFWPILVLVGFPFTANFKTGAAVFLSPNGGYLFGYVLMAVVTGYFYRLFNDYFDWLFNTKKINFIKLNLIILIKWLNIMIAGVIGTIALHIVGLSYFMMVTGYSLQQAIKCCVVPFIFADFVKLLLSAGWINRSDKHFKKLWGRWWWIWM